MPPYGYFPRQSHLGELLGGGIQSFAENFRQAREGVRQRRLQDEERQTQGAIQNYELAQHGVHLTGAGETPPTQQLRPSIPEVQRTPDGTPTGSVFRSMLGANLPSAPTENRYDFGQGYYVDRAEEEANLRRQTNLSAGSEFQKAYLNAAGQSAGNPSLTNYRTQQAAKIQEEMAHPKPMAPVLGSPEYMRAETDLEKMRAGLRPQPSQYVFPVGGTQEAPQIMRANTKTGEVVPTGQGRPATGQEGERGAAQIAVAQQQVQTADADMRKFEDELLSGRRTISAKGAAAAKLALRGGPISSTAAETGLDVFDPDLARYVRSALAVATAERLITPRGGSNAMTQSEALLSKAGSHPDSAQVAQARAYRQALVTGLQHGQGKTPPPSGTDLLSKYGITPVRRP